MARISPLRGSMATTAPLRSPRASSAARWMSMSMVSFRSWPGMACWVPQVAHLAAVAVHDHIAGAVLAAQQLVVGLLDARLAHHVARLVDGIARIVQILFAHLAHVADQVGGKAVAGIEPALLVDGFQLGQLVAVGLDEGLLVGGDVLLDGDGLVAGRGPVAAQGGAQLLQIEIQPAGDQRQVGVHVAVLLADQEAGDGGVVVHDQPVLAVEELAARRPAPAPCECGSARQAGGSSPHPAPAAATARRPAPASSARMPYCTTASLRVESFSPRVVPLEYIRLRLMITLNSLRCCVGFQIEWMIHRILVMSPMASQRTIREKIKNNIVDLRIFWDRVNLVGR